MTTTREEFEAWMTSETNVREDAVWHEDKQRYTLLSRKQADWVLWQAAHLAGQRAMQERVGTLCDELEQHWSDYKDTALINGNVALSNAASGEPRAARAIKAAVLMMEVKPS